MTSTDEIVRTTRLGRFDALAQALAFEMTMVDEHVWQAVTIFEDGVRRRFKDGEGEEFSLDYDVRADRIEVRGHYPQLPDGRPWYPGSARLESDAITVAATRTPRAIAQDIARRFLPTYRAYLVKASEARASQIDWRSKTQVTYDKIVAASGGTIRPQTAKAGSDNEITERIYNVGGVSYGTLRVNGDSVRFDQFSVTPEFAVKIAALMAQERVK